MNRTALLATSALRSLFPLGLVIASAAPAYAQDVSPRPQDGRAIQAYNPATLGQNETELESGRAVDETSSEGIVVTGTRINRPNLVSTVPITSIGAQELTSTGNRSRGDTLNQLPPLRPTYRPRTMMSRFHQRPERTRPSWWTRTSTGLATTTTRRIARLTSTVCQ